MEKIALVTGAGKRLGRAMALYLAERGYDLALHYAGSQAEAEEVAALIRAKGRRAVTQSENPEHSRGQGKKPRTRGLPLVAPWQRFRVSTAGGCGLHPSWGTKIPRAPGPK